MKYLVNKETKEHIRYYEDSSVPLAGWDIVEPDSEGWIAHTGSECPLPDDAPCHVMFKSGTKSGKSKAKHWSWQSESITHYHPILEPAPQYGPRSVSFNLLDRLEEAHEAAQTIPDLEAELREVLGSMGYDLVARSPFVEPEPAVETPQGPFINLGDWRNWKNGDLVELKEGIGSGHIFKTGVLYTVVEVSKSGYTLKYGNHVTDKCPILSRVNDFRFHSRPAKGEK